ncbi:hypothetical protein DPMN_169959, partial [Dreissena polymorpha]
MQLPTLPNPKLPKAPIGVRRPDSRGAPGSFKCPVYSTDTLHPRLTSLAEDLLYILLQGEGGGAGG